METLSPILVFIAIIRTGLVNSGLFSSLSDCLFSRESSQCNSSSMILNTESSKSHQDTTDPFENIKRDRMVWESSRKCHQILNFLPLDATPLVMKECETRFQVLNAEHALHQNRFREPMYLNWKQTKQSPTRLMVLDLDETILDQRSYITETRHQPELWKKTNSEELIVNGLSLNESLGLPFLSLIVFRKDLMEFIHFAHYQKAYHLMVYSLGLKHVVIYHAVTIELYYNFVYSVRREKEHKNKQKPFHFKAVISRPENIKFPRDGVWIQKPKSLMNIVKAMGNHRRSLDHYRTVAIVDDQVDSVWNKQIPPFLNYRTTSFLWVTPSKFCMEDENEVDPLLLNTTTNRQIREIKARRASDLMFRRLWRIFTQLEDNMNRGMSMSVIIREKEVATKQPQQPARERTQRDVAWT